MEKNSLLNELHSSGAILKGHFLLSSGLHSDTYVQCALLLKSPRRAQKFAHALVELIPQNVRKTIDLVVAPALGGLIIGYEVARLLNKDFLFFERFQGELSLRRSFQIESGQNIFLVEDVITTAGSSIDILLKMSNFGAKIPVAASIIDRSNGTAEAKFNEYNCEFFSIVQLNCLIFNSDNIPKNIQDIPCVKPGSNKQNT